jgi:hypothetical protein
VTRDGGLLGVEVDGAALLVEPSPAPWGSRIDGWLAADRFFVAGGGTRPRRVTEVTLDGQRALRLEEDPAPSPDPLADLARALDALSEEPSPWFGGPVGSGFFPDAADWGEAVEARAARCAEALRRTDLVAQGLGEACRDTICAVRPDLAEVRRFALVHGDLVPRHLRRDGAALVLDGWSRAWLGDPVLDLAPVWLAPSSVQSLLRPHLSEPVRRRLDEHATSARGRAAMLLHLVQELHERALDLRADGCKALDVFVRAEEQLADQLGLGDPESSRWRRTSVVLLAAIDDPSAVVRLATGAAAGRTIDAGLVDLPPTGRSVADDFAQLEVDVASVLRHVENAFTPKFVQMASQVRARVGHRLPPAWGSAVAARARGWAWREARGARFGELAPPG